MKLATSIALALLLTSPSLAAAQSPAEGTAAQGAADAKPAAGAKDGATAKKPRKGAKGKAPEPSGPSLAARSHARRVKSVYIYAAESCARAPDRCDQALLADSEVRFLEACGACNTMQRCEQERDAVKAGTARSSRDPCAP